MENQKFNSCLQDLMITMPTLLIISNRKEEAYFVIERCILICEKYGYEYTQAKLILMVASIFLNDKNRDHNEVWEKAHEALNMFIGLD